MSDLERITGLKHLRVRGMPQVRLSATLKATGLNIRRAMTFKNRLKRPKTAQVSSEPSGDRLFNAVKEHLRLVYDYFQDTVFAVATFFHQIYESTPKVA